MGEITTTFIITTVFTLFSYGNLPEQPSNLIIFLKFSLNHHVLNPIIIPTSFSKALSREFTTQNS